MKMPNAAHDVIGQQDKHVLHREHVFHIEAQAHAMQWHVHIVQDPRNDCSCPQWDEVPIFSANSIEAPILFTVVPIHHSILPQHIPIHEQP